MKRRVRINIAPTTSPRLYLKFNCVIIIATNTECRFGYDP